MFKRISRIINIKEMIVRSYDGTLVEIRINDFINDKEYYKKMILIKFNLSIPDD